MAPAAAPPTSAAASSTTSAAPQRAKGPYPFWLGGVSASIAASITHPLDLTKVRLQASGDKKMIQSMKRTVQVRGVLGLWDGISGTIFRQMTYSLCRFWAYDQAKLIVHPGKGALSPVEMVTAGSLAGAIAGVVGNPGEIIMVRMQGDMAKPISQQLGYKNCFDALFRMTKEEGFSSWARGLSPNVIRSILMNSSQLGSYDIFKKSLLETPYFEDNMKLHFTASCLAGTVATTVCSPADVIKSRVMNASGAGSSSVLAVISNSFKNEGPLFMFKGWIPAWIRLQPTTVLIFLTFEQLKNATDWFNSRKLAIPAHI